METEWGGICWIRVKYNAAVQYIAKERVAAQAAMKRTARGTLQTLAQLNTLRAAACADAMRKRTARGTTQPLVQSNALLPAA